MITLSFASTCSSETDIILLLATLSVFYSHFLRVPVCPDGRRGRISSGGHLSQTKMGPQIQNPKGQKSNGWFLSNYL